MSAVSMLDTRAAQFKNVLTGDIDLSPYYAESQAHRVKPADAYREEVEQGLFNRADIGRPMPWAAFRNRFEFRQHELSIWSGYKGHGKSAVISQVFDSFMAAGQKAFILSPEFRPAKVIERMIFQRLKTRLVSKAQLDEWFAWASNILWLYDAQKSLKADEVVAICRYAIDNFGVNHILVDSLMKCGMGTDDYTAQKRFVDQLQSLAHLFPVHVHLVAHARKGGSDDLPPKLHDIKGTSEIADMAENVLIVWRNKPKEKSESLGDASHSGEPDALITVEAQRNADGWIGAVPMFFDRQSMTFSEVEGRQEWAAL